MSELRLVAYVSGVRHLVKEEHPSETPGDGLRLLTLWCGHTRLKPLLRGWVYERNLGWAETGCWRCEKNLAHSLLAALL